MSERGEFKRYRVTYTWFQRGSGIVEVKAKSKYQAGFDVDFGQFDEKKAKVESINLFRTVVKVEEL